jgi:hypothetical protein
MDVRVLNGFDSSENKAPLVIILFLLRLITNRNNISLHAQLSLPPTVEQMLGGGV